MSPLPAFTVATLTSQRWLLDSCPDGVDNPFWHSVLKVCPNKQELFMHRVLFLFQRASKRSTRAAACRLPASEWNNELDRMCLAYYIMEQMEMATTQDEDRMFDDDVMKTVVKRTVDGNLSLISPTGPGVLLIFEC